MRRKKISFETVREMGLALPDVEEGTVYGSPALKVGGKMFACLAIHRSAEPDSLAIRIDFDQRQELIAADPSTYLPDIRGTRAEWAATVFAGPVSLMN